MKDFLRELFLSLLIPLGIVTLGLLFIVFWKPLLLMIIFFMIMSILYPKSF